MEFDDFKLRELKGRAGVRVFKAPNGSKYEATAAPMASAPHVLRITLQRVGARRKVLAELPYVDVHFSPEMDLEKLTMKNIKMAIFNAAETEKTQGKASEYLTRKWGAPPP
jgi:hypothetical protein